MLVLKYVMNTRPDRSQTIIDKRLCALCNYILQDCNEFERLYG